MSEMVERVALALWRAEHHTGVELLPMGDDAPRLRESARAAISAMREATDGMQDEGFYEACCHIWYYEGDGAGFEKDGIKKVWQAMIDEALK